MTIRVEHEDQRSGCEECFAPGTVRIEFSVAGVHIILCDVCWEELVLKLQARPVPGPKLPERIVEAAARFAIDGGFRYDADGRRLDGPGGKPVLGSARNAQIITPKAPSPLEALTAEVIEAARPPTLSDQYLGLAVPGHVPDPAPCRYDAETGDYEAVFFGLKCSSADPTWRCVNCGKPTDEWPHEGCSDGPGKPIRQPIIGGTMRKVLTIQEGDEVHELEPATIDMLEQAAREQQAKAVDAPVVGFEESAPQGAIPRAAIFHEPAPYRPDHVVKLTSPIEKKAGEAVTSEEIAERIAKQANVPVEPVIDWVKRAEFFNQTAPPSGVTEDDLRKVGDDFDPGPAKPGDRERLAKLEGQLADLQATADEEVVSYGRCANGDQCKGDGSLGGYVVSLPSKWGPVVCGACPGSPEEPMHVRLDRMAREVGVPEHIIELSNELVRHDEEVAALTHDTTVGALLTVCALERAEVKIAGGEMPTCHVCAARRALEVGVDPQSVEETE